MRQPLLGEEHVLRAAEPDALRAELPRNLGVARDVRVGAHVHRADLVHPLHQRAELAAHLRLHGLHLAQDHLARAAVDGDPVSLLDGILPTVNFSVL